MDGGIPRSFAALGATGGPRIAFGAVGILGLCKTGEVLNECVRRGPLGAVGGGVPDLGTFWSGRENLASLNPVSDTALCESVKFAGLGPKSGGLTGVRDILGDTGTLDALA